MAQEHVGQQGDILVAVEYFPSGNAVNYFPAVGVLGEFYFKTKSTAFPFVRWDVNSTSPLPMIPYRSSVPLEAMHNIPVFSGNFQNLPGTYKIYFGYRFQQNEVPVFVHNFPEYPLIFTVTP
ncbi:hypothetical protein BGP_3600 [Beggiatoa sp. PS]|nr:hypothetical protein BGP_3600 [Beggiatoa sp. PS]